MTYNHIWHGDNAVLGHDVEGPIHSIITDPPYGMALKMNSATTPDGKAKNREIIADGDIETARRTFYDAMAPLIPKLADEADIYVFTAWHVLKEWFTIVEELDPNIHLKMMLLWEKGYPGKGDLVANWGCGHEVILYLKKGRRPVARRRSGILHFGADIHAEIAYQEAYLQLLYDIRDGKEDIRLPDLGFIAVDKIASGQNIHPSEKPPELIEELIKMSTNEGDLVVDPFSGSGSTAVAAQRTGRNSVSIEADAVYIEPSRARLETGTLW